MIYARVSKFCLCHSYSTALVVQKQLQKIHNQAGFTVFLLILPFIKTGSELDLAVGHGLLTLICAIPDRSIIC